MNWRKVLFGALLVMGVIASAVQVVYLSYESRQLLGEYDELFKQRHELEVERGQLLLEESALASHARVEELAVADLRMKVPNVNEIVLVGFRK